MKVYVVMLHDLDEQLYILDVFNTSELAADYILTIEDEYEDSFLYVVLEEEVKTCL